MENPQQQAADTMRSRLDGMFGQINRGELDCTGGFGRPCTQEADERGPWPTYPDTTALCPSCSALWHIGQAINDLRDHALRAEAIQAEAEVQARKVASR